MNSEDFQITVPFCYLYHLSESTNIPKRNYFCSRMSFEGFRIFYFSFWYFVIEVTRRWAKAMWLAIYTHQKVKTEKWESFKKGFRLWVPMCWKNWNWRHSQNIYLKIKPKVICFLLFLHGSYELMKLLNIQKRWNL